MSLMNRLKRISDSGQPCLTPFLILKDFEYWSIIFIKFNKKLINNFNLIFNYISELIVII